MRLLSTYLQRNQNQPRQRNGSPKRYRRPNLPPLFYSIIGRNWQASLHRIRTHAHRQPNEIYAVEDTSGDTPLHFACRLDPPVEIVKALMSICHVKNVEGATPLHVAASHRCSAEVMEVMVRYGIDDLGASDGAKEPLVLSLSNRLRTPMHYACLSFRGLSIDAFKILLEATIEASMKAEKSSNMNQIDLTSNTVTNEFKSINTMAIEKDKGMDLEWNDQDDNMDLDDAVAANKSADERNEAASAFTMQDQFGHSPLSLLFKRYRERVKYVIRFLESKSSRSISSSAAAASVQEELGGLWLKARLTVCFMAQIRREGNGALLSATDDSCQKEDAIAIEAARWAAQRHQSNSENENEEDYDDEIIVGDCSGRVFRLVHASVALAGYGCPKEMIQLAISVYPNQVREMDEDGNLPLHIAAVASSFLPLDGHFQAAPNTSTNNSDEDSIISSISNLSDLSGDRTAKPFHTVIQMLLKSYPEAARIPHGVSGRLPLILAMEAKKRTMSDGMKLLLEAYPAALETQDLDPRLYPYIMAEIGKSREVKVRGGSRRFPSFGKKKEVIKRHVPLALFKAIRARPNLLETGKAD